MNLQGRGASATDSLECPQAPRPIEETTWATLEWARTRPDDHEWRAGLTPEREAELLRA